MGQNLSTGGEGDPSGSTQGQPEEAAGVVD